jgi:serine/threonine-protein kinase SRPK3
MQVYEMVTGEPLMRRNIQQESVPSIHMLLFGDYPPEMVKRGKYSSFFFNSDGE